MTCVSAALRHFPALPLAAPVLVLLVLVGCHRPRSGGDSAPPLTSSARARGGTAPAVVSSQTGEPSPASSREPEPPIGPPPLEGEPLRELSVEGFNPAVVSVPLGVREPRPVVLAFHGNYDRPEWQCEVWRSITAGQVWVLCPRGVPRGDAPKRLDRWTYAGTDKLARELDAALAALVEAYPDYVDVAYPVFTGFSLGAILGVRLISRNVEAPRFRSAVLVEGGYKGWGHGTAKAFHAQGGRRVLFACGQTACMHASKRASRVLKQREVLSDIVSGGNIGHTYDGAVAEAVQAAWAWVVADDPRFGQRPSEASPE